VNKIQTHLAKEPSNAWDDIKKLAGIPTKSANRQNVDTDPNKLNSFYARFEKDTSQTAPVAGGLQHQNNCVPFGKITSEQVRTELQKLDTRKGPGPDKIITKVLKYCADQLAGTVCVFYNRAIEEGTTPKLWRTAVIKPVPKVPHPNRPIAFTCHLCKVLEKLIKPYIISNTNIDPLQFAYQTKRSSQDALMCLLTSITRFIDIRPTNYVRAPFLDFSSAFNTINVSTLISSLYHELGFEFPYQPPAVHPHQP
jgi:hypothetical protein